MTQRCSIWAEPQQLGFSVKSLDELKSALDVGANLVELKLEKFEENGTPIFTYDGKQFRQNSETITEVMKLCQGRCSVNFHMHLERQVDREKNNGINIALTEHHDVALARHIVLEEIWQQHGLGRVLTVHPPTISMGGKQIIAENEALENARSFLERLDAERIRLAGACGLSKIGLENQTDAKTNNTMLGYLPKHFKKMLLDTRTIGLTIDSGHRRLAKNFSVSEFIGLGIPIVNFHFHGNNGEFCSDNYDDDQHLPPTPERVKGYQNYLRFFRRHRTPVVLELASLKNYTTDEMRTILETLRLEIG